MSSLALATARPDSAVGPVLADAEPPRLLRVWLGAEAVTLPMAALVEVLRTPTITRLPQTPAWLLGVTHVQGRVVSAVDLAAFLGLPPLLISTSRTGDTRLLVVHSRTERGPLETGWVVSNFAPLSAGAGAPRSSPGSSPATEPAPLAGAVNDQPARRTRLADFAAGYVDDQGTCLPILAVDRLLRDPDFLSIGSPGGSIVSRGASSLDPSAGSAPRSTRTDADSGRGAPE